MNTRDRIQLHDRMKANETGPNTHVIDVTKAIAIAETLVGDIADGAREAQLREIAGPLFVEYEANGGHGMPEHNARRAIENAKVFLFHLEAEVGESST